MKELFAMLVLVGLLVFGGWTVSGAMNSAAWGWAEGQRHQAYAAVSIAQIEAQTQIRLQELRMLENAYSRSMFMVTFLPVVTVAVLLLAGVIWLMVWRELRRPAVYNSSNRRQIEGDWYPALPAQRQRGFERETLIMERDYWESHR